YVALDMLDGRTLDGILAARERLPVDDVVAIGRQIAEALAFAHGRGVLHRDLKPSNVFVAKSEVGSEIVKLIDLGVAALRDMPHIPKLTTAHEVIGTPEYMSPEQLFARDVDARSDVWALGMTLYECLSGNLPFTGT